MIDPRPVDTDAPELFPPVAPVELDCPAGTVPGWLGEDGLPTSCVGDDPQVFPPALPLDELAATGVHDVVAWIVVVASLLILGGLVVAALREWRRS